MKIVDKFIAIDFLKSLFFITAGFLSILYIVDFFNHLSFLSEPVESLFIVKYYLYKLPFFVYIILPFSILFSTIITYGRLNDTNQLTSLFNTGLSIYRIAIPALVTVVSLSILFFLLNDSLVSKGITASKFIENNIIKHPSSYENGIFAKSKNYILNAQTLDINNKTAYMPILYKKNGSKFVEIKADRAFFGKKTTLHNAVIRTYSDNGVSYKYKKIMILNLNFNISDILLHSSTFSTLSLKELWKLRKIGNSRYQFMIFDRLFSFTMPIIMFILALSIVAKPFKREESSIKATGVGMLYGAGYFLFHAILAGLGKSSMISPLIGAATPHITFLLFALMKIEED